MHPTVYVSNVSEKRTPTGRGGWAVHRRRFTLESLPRCSRSRPYSYRSLRLQPLANLSHSYTQTPLGGPGTRGEYRIMTPEGLRKKRRTREWKNTRETKEAKMCDERVKKITKNRDEQEGEGRGREEEEERERKREYDVPLGNGGFPFWRPHLSEEL